MRVIKMLSIGLFFGVLALSSTRLLADDAAAKPIFGPWAQAKVGDFMTATIPGKFKTTSIELTEDVRKKIDLMETYSLDNTNSDDYQCLVTNVIYNKGIMADLDGAAKGSIDNMKANAAIKDFKVGQKYIKKFGMDGIMFWGTFTAEGQKATFQSEIFIKRNYMWMVLIIDATKERYDKITQYIFSTYNIAPPQ